MKYILVVGYLFLCICSLLICRFLAKKDSKLSKWIKSNYHKIIIIVIAIGSLVWMLCFADQKSLWYDDLFQISFSGNNQSFYEVFHNIVTIDLQPPLFAFIAMFWLRIAPYGTGWIKLISELAVFFAIILIGLTASKAFNKRVGIFSSILLGTSYVAILDGAYSFRPYGYVIFFTILMIYC
uniref:glycosyltransferase family 39 protein n=1 Tax=Robinsoniella peoriensis TaxID=180332 RepID=UPI00114C8E06